MDNIINQTATIVALSCAGLFFMTGLVAGVWKYACMVNNPAFKAPHYVDIAHRSALLYAFAALLIAVFASLSAFNQQVNLLAATAPLIFFAFAIAKYISLGIKNETNNTLRDSKNPGLDRLLMTALIVGELGGFSVLLVGFFLRIQS